MLAFQHIIDVQSSALCFQIDIIFRVFNESFYEVKIATTCLMNMTVFGFSRIIFDKTAIQALGFCYFQYGLLESTNGNTSPLTFSTTPFISNNFMMGMKSFHVNVVNSFKFTTTIGTTTSVASTTMFTYLSFMYWSFKLRVCPTGFPYFEPPTLLCYDVCPNGYYGDPVQLMCLKCHYSCLTCSAYTTCTSCDPAANRILSSSSCIPNTGYYDNSTTIAVLCTSIDTNCQTCANTTTFSCQICADGYYLDSTGGCTVCSSTCATCTSAVICITCRTGFNLDSASACVAPLCTDPNCVDCPSSSLICATCLTGYRVQSDSTCATVCGDRIVAGT